MIIGIEARSATHPQLGGYKTYVQSLIAGLSQLDSPHIFNLYGDRLATNWFPPPADHLEMHTVSNHFPLIRHVVREQVQLPRRARIDRCSLVHYTANSGPLNSRTSYVVTLHDVISLTAPQAAPGLSRPRLWQWLISAYDRFVIPRVAHRSRAVITVSEFERRQIADTLGISLDKIFVTPLAPSLVFQPVTGLALDQVCAGVESTYQLKHGFFVTVGYEPRKNIARVIEAYQSLDNSLRHQHGLLIVCARESVRQELRAYIHRLGLDGSVRVIGGVDHRRLCEIYNAAAAMVFPSLRESFGLPPLEALACGTPVIASNVSSLPEVLGDAAVFVAPTDVRALAAAMTSVLTTPELSKQLREYGLARSRQYSWRKTAEQTIRVYESALVER